MSRVAKLTLALSFTFAVGTIVGVHYMQQSERKTMFKGVLRDDERRRQKMRQREEELQISQKKHQLYESVQPVGRHNSESSSSTSTT